MITGIVLCGGKSRRMGSDKTEMLFGEKTWLEHACDTLAEAGAAHIVCAGRPDVELGVFDVVENCGPVAGICSALSGQEALQDLVIVVPVDMPTLSAPDLIGLAEQAQSSNRPTFYLGSPLPFACPTQLLSERVIQNALGRLHAGETLSVRAFLSELGSVTIPFDGRTALKNFNTPEDLKSLPHY
ncbi:molybdenum cofactor guanylyltransferase [Asticcacaulis sp. BYS171W]|uniref:Molybdenum cofactor guanylyltransferase n=1 Tax=Asticcacaulis aquaticus TaxID=2984212 RepID=A0ABT5HWX0_9CAUL|nr:molybdenum cofactor guanylyltransferase [Asticcacaulis aquaticus]MDC7684428.1 molybdenum cofactor guanylyltransferase [Asticcacaulis aquaticus]